MDRLTRFVVFALMCSAWFGSSAPSADAVGEAADTEIILDVPIGNGSEVDIFRPASPGSYPAVVVFHGGGWITSYPDSVAGFGHAIAAGGAVVFNATYRAAANGGGYPETFEDGACAVAWVAANGGQYGANGDVVVVGYSSGAHIGLMAALGGERWNNCGSQWVTPDAMISVAAAYDIYQEAAQLSRLIGAPDANPAIWHAVDPMSHIRRELDVPLLLLHGLDDAVVDPENVPAYRDARRSAGGQVDTVVWPDVDHESIILMADDGQQTVDVIGLWLRRLRR